MKNDLTEKELWELASQLSCPVGKMGTEVGQKMNATNMNMALETLSTLKMCGNDILLEIGHGNCGHLKNVLKAARNIRYYGLDISETMKMDAEKINWEQVKKNQASFHLYDGQHIPFKNDLFTKAMAVNTIYFWEEPLELLKEIYRILQDGGRFSIGFVQKRFMSKLPFVNYRFELYDTGKIEKLLKDTPFKILGIRDKTESVKSKTGELVEREFTVVTVGKNCT